MPEPKITKLPRKEPGQRGRPKIHPVVDLTGQKKASWTFVRCLTPGKGMTETRYLCRCDCGYEKEMQIHNILSGDSRSCEANCGRGQQLRQHGWLEPGQTPGSRIKNLGRARSERDSLIANDSQQPFTA